LNAAFLEPAFREALGEPNLRVSGVHPVAGGCIGTAVRAATTSGDFFAKWSDRVPDELFLREADGLRALRAAGTELAIPDVVFASAPEPERPALILMEYLQTDKGAADDEALGHGLATLHRRCRDDFGFDVPSYCGTTRQDNTRSASWPDFYARMRVLPLLRSLERERGVSVSEVRVFERVVERLPSLLAPEPAASLIHGDLWSGNVMATPAGPALVDPACAYADREMEFGITTLFGGFSQRFFAAYQEAWPLAPGWRDRNPLYQLYHLLNHALLFGGGYGSQALAIARRFA
jgi:fructosamine-3-kinase